MTSLSHIDLHYPHFLTYTSIFLQKLSVFQGRPDWSPTSLIRLHPRKHLSLLCNIWNRLQVPLPNLLPLCCWTDRIFVEWSKENKKLQLGVVMGQCQDIVYLGLMHKILAKQKTLTAWISNPTYFMRIEFSQLLKSIHFPGNMRESLFFHRPTSSTSPEWVDHSLSDICRVGDPKLQYQAADQMRTEDAL